MYSRTSDAAPTGLAEKAFRDAFERLKRGRPVRLSTSAIVSQNNVAKEAGRDPSALRKSRYPILIEEIQNWIKANAVETTLPTGRTSAAERRRSRTLKEKLAELKAERDHLASLLVEADTKILELSLDNAHLRNSLTKDNVVSMGLMKNSSTSSR